MRTPFGSIGHFFDKLEDKIRGRLSRKPFLYGFLGFLGTILIWKGIWESAEIVPWLFGPGSIILGVIILISTGLFISTSIGEAIILTGIKGEKRVSEKTEAEVMAEKSDMQEVLSELKEIEKDVEELKREKGSEVVSSL
jgi:hypothetical protein